jgi:hypothetical protein
VRTVLDGQARRTHYFATSAQCRTETPRHEAIGDDDLLVIESEGVVGLVFDGSPFAVTEISGELQPLRSDFIAHCSSYDAAVLGRAEALAVKLGHPLRTTDPIA